MANPKVLPHWHSCVSFGDRIRHQTATEITTSPQDIVFYPSTWSCYLFFNIIFILIMAHWIISVSELNDCTEGADRISPQQARASYEVCVIAYPDRPGH